jgi:hypothetical protein
MAETAISKSRLLREAGYTYDFERMVYVNSAKKKVFSIEFIEDHSKDEIRSRLDEHTDGEWSFYFNQQPSPAVKRELESVLA